MSLSLNALFSITVFQSHGGYPPPPSGHGGPMGKKGYMTNRDKQGYGGYDEYDDENYEGEEDEDMGDEEYDDFTKELNQYRKAKEGGMGGMRGRGTHETLLVGHKCLSLNCAPNYILKKSPL